MTHRYRFYVDWINREGKLETSGHLASGPAEAVEIQRHELQDGERLDCVRAKPDVIECEGGACHLLSEPARTELEARFKTEAQAINDVIAAIRGLKALHAALPILAAE